METIRGERPRASGRKDSDEQASSSDEEVARHDDEEKDDEKEDEKASEYEGEIEEARRQRIQPAGRRRLDLNRAAPTRHSARARVRPRARSALMHEYAPPVSEAP